MSNVVYKCPSCGGPLVYSGESGQMACGACGQSYDVETIEAMHQAKSGNDIHIDLSAEEIKAEDEVFTCTCSGCGAELLTEATTTATECPYCGSPVVLREQIAEGVRPQMVVPFTVTKEEAVAQFEQYFKGKRLLPNLFLEGRNRIAEIRRLYVPYWLFDCDADGEFVYDAQRIRRWREGDWEVICTEYYILHRKGGMRFEAIPVDGSQKLDNKITESLEPYDMSQAVEFTPAVLSGAYADRADVDAQACTDRVSERLENSVSMLMRDTVYGYDRVSERSRYVHTGSCQATPVLLPVWLITTVKEEVTYTFAINGQTGKLTCNVPTDKGKAFGWGAGIFAGVFGLGTLITHLTGLLQEETAMSLVGAGILALLVAVISVGSMKAKLKQAAFQSAAQPYLVDGSFSLEIDADRYLYRTTHRRKIETNNK